MASPDIPSALLALDPEARRQTLDALVASWDSAVPAPDREGWVNMHCHTIYSYNGYGHSPSSLAWLAARQGWHAMATVDFDVLDGVDETLEAGDRVGIRVAAGMETRVYAPEFADIEINSPGEPGVLYHCGLGFTSSRAPEAARATLDDMRARAASRNLAVIERVNRYLAPVQIDYVRDVLPLTPSGNATERHILVAYDAAARVAYTEREALLAFWAEKLGTDVATVDAFMGDEPFPHDMIRAKLMKRGGVGYVQPGPDTFPHLDDVNRAIIACGAIPVVAWLDGTTAGEQRMDELLRHHITRGAGAFNIIPDRNWNLPDVDQRARKVVELYRVVELARAHDLPIIVGTEMNKAGQRLIDDFDAEPLQPLRQDMLDGANFIFGHTVMQRALGLGYWSSWAEEHLGERRAKNAFYTAVGAAVTPGGEALSRLAAIEARGPEALLTHIRAAF